MSSGCVVGTISTTICEPFCCSKAASLASSAWRCAASSVPVWSITRAVERRHRQQVLGLRAGRARQATRKRAVSARRMRAAVICAERYFFGAPKSTVGGVEICASFCTLKVGLGS